MQFSIVQFSNKEPISLRLDAEYYRPIFLDTEEKLKAGKWTYLETLTKSIKSFGAYSLCNQVEYKEEGIPFLRCKDIKNGFIDFSDVLYIDSDANNLLWKSEVKPKTVLFTMSGTVGNSAIATEKIRYPINSNQDIAKITTNDKLNPYYFSIFLQSAHGKRQITRLPVGSVQQHIFLWQLEKLVVPLLSGNFQVKIENIFRDSLFLQEKSIKIFKEAQTFLLSELGIANWQPQHQLTFVKNYSDTEQAGRIDAEYYQPKYEEIIKAIQNYSGGWDTLENLVTVKKCVEVGSGEYRDEGIPFVRVSNISSFEITEEKYISEKLYQKIKQHQPKKGEILFSKDASPGTAYYLNESPQKMIPSGGILRLKNKSDKINNEYLTLVLNSILTKEQVNRDVGGSVILHWRPDQVKDTVIPILSEAKQAQIRQKVTESFNLRKQSKHLLGCTKRAVEMAIEQDEQNAINWLKEQTRDIGVMDADY